MARRPRSAAEDRGAGEAGRDPRARKLTPSPPPPPLALALAAGKSTLLQILAGKRLTRSGAQVLGQDVFFSTPKGVTYLGPSPPSSRHMIRAGANEDWDCRDRVGREPRRAVRPRGRSLPVRASFPERNRDGREKHLELIVQYLGGE